MKKRYLIAMMVVMLVAVSGLARGEEDSRMVKGAVVGAGTNVLAEAALDTLDGSSNSEPQYIQVQGPDGQMYLQPVTAPPEDPNKIILKRAVQGAVTGAVAAEMAKDDQKKESGESWWDKLFGGKSDEKSETAPLKTTSSADKIKKSKDIKEGKKPEGWRPPGWDQGKKTGWGDEDVPPGWSKRRDNDDDDGNDSQYKNKKKNKKDD
jgi:hypothetical protein